jgi:hypothetical protein
MINFLLTLLFGPKWKCDFYNNRSRKKVASYTVRAKSEYLADDKGWSLWFNGDDYDDLAVHQDTTLIKRVD